MTTEDSIKAKARDMQKARRFDSFKSFLLILTVGGVLLTGAGIIVFFMVCLMKIVYNFAFH